MTEINENNIKINEPITGDECQCFVIGSQVDDFHTLNSDDIFNLNVCGTQELYK